MKKLTLTAFTVFCTLLVAAITVPVLAQEADERGDLIWVISDKVSPAHMMEYEGWIKEFKKHADETGAPDYAVSQNSEGFNYFMNLGKDMVGMDEVNKMWENWTGMDKANEMGKKYRHLINYQEMAIWRHAPNHSYVPADYKGLPDAKYTRVSWNWIYTGKGEEADAVIKEFKQLWADSGISHAVNSYWNVMGQEVPLVIFVENFNDKESYLASEKEIESKVDKDKLKDLQARWMSVVRKMDQTESWRRPDLAHANEVN